MSTVNAPSSALGSSYLSETFENVINGKTVPSSSTYEVVNPATGQVFARAPEATKEQLDEAVSAARTAFPAWKAKTWDERREVLRNIATVLEDEQFAAKLAKLVVLEMGKPIWLATREVGMCITWIRGSLELSLENPTIIKEDEKSSVSVRYVPLGVGAGIVPWNFPLLIATAKIVPAFLTGNVLILKPSPYAPLATLTLVAKIQHLLPPGVLSILSGGNDLGKWITAHPGIDKVAFTGSIQTGKNVLTNAIGTLKRVTLELGGNDPCIVLPDVDLANVALPVFLGSFLNSGQICTASKRLYVHEDIYDDFVKAMIGCAANMKVGDPSDASSMMGPVCNAYQYGIVRDLINDCREQGYKFALGGDVDENSAGYFIPLTLVDNPPEDSRIVQEEPFGPVVPVLKWKDESDVIRRANATKCGLGSSVWGKDEAAVHRIASQLEAGMVWVNEQPGGGPTQPFGGHKESGWGTENGIEGLRHWCNVQTVSVSKGAKL